MDQEKIDLIRKLFVFGFIKTDFKNPFTFNSRWRSPIYSNIRGCRTKPVVMNLILDLLKNVFISNESEIVMGVYNGAAAFSERLAQILDVPSGYVVSKEKRGSHGLDDLIVGNVKGKRVMLIEDVISTATSILNDKKIIRDAGADEIFCVSILDYCLPGAMLHPSMSTGYLTLLTIHDLMPELKKQLSLKEIVLLKSWIADPEHWYDKHKDELVELV